MTGKTGIFFCNWIFAKDSTLLSIFLRLKIGVLGRQEIEKRRNGRESP
jgi:hypothetical protein